MIFGRHGMTLDPSISFDGKEEPAIPINLSAEWGRDGQRILLDIAHPFIQELAANKDARFFELVEWLVPYAIGEIEKAHAKEDEEPEEELEPEKSTPELRPGYVYLLKSGDGYYKIGRSKDVERRMKDFGVQLPCPLEVLHIIPAKDMYRSEEGLHKRYAHCRIRGEWFALTKEEVLSICSITEL